MIKLPDPSATVGENTRDIFDLLPPESEERNSPRAHVVKQVGKVFIDAERVLTLSHLILNRLVPTIEPQTIPEQAGFRAGKSTTSQILNMTEFIEEGYEENCFTGIVFIDLSAAYDTVNHRQLCKKVLTMTEDGKLTRIIKNLLGNRRFYVELQGKCSRWRNQKNGLPQGSVLAPILFNIFTNDQPMPKETKSFIFADDRAIACQASDLTKIERTLENALNELGRYYEENNLRPNPSKTETCVFHLKNKLAATRLKINWNGEKIKHAEFPKYLGVTLDRTLTYKKHCSNTAQKVAARNNLLQKLTSASWGANPNVLRTTALALCYAAAEYACPVWSRSSHCNKVNIVLNETCRRITGCIKTTKISKLHALAGISPPEIRREAATRREKWKQETDERHPMYGHEQKPRRLKSRQSFLSTTRACENSQRFKTKKWNLLSGLRRENLPPLEERLPPGGQLPWKTWKSLNRLRAEAGRCRETLHKWGTVDSPLCECGIPENMTHLTQCPLRTVVTTSDLWSANGKAIQLAQEIENFI